MFTTSLCIPSAGIVPGSSGPPNWITGSTKLDDPNWGGCLQLSYGQLGMPNQLPSAEQATFRALFAGTDLFLSWLVRVDPDNFQDITFDALHLGFSIGAVGSPQQRAALLRIEITQNNLPSKVSDNQFKVETYLWDPINKWKNPAQGNQIAPIKTGQYGWMLDPTNIHNIRVWTVQPFDNTPFDPNSPNPLQGINTVAWAVQMRIPIGTIIPAGLAVVNGVSYPSSDFTLSNSFQMWYSMVVKTPSNPAVDSVLQYTWPEGTPPDFYVVFDPATGIQNIFPDPSSTASKWGTVTVGANAACSGGIAITSANIGTGNNPSSFIDPNNPNLIFADPLNRGAGAPVGSPIDAKDITARFRLANWGSQALPNPPTNLNMNWTDIRGGEAVAGHNNLQIPNNNTGGPTTGGHFIDFSWSLNNDEKTFYTFVDPVTKKDQTHQCMLVELSSPTKHYTFLNSSVVKNMDFHNPPLPLIRIAEINIRGLVPIAAIGREVFLHLQLANLPHAIGVGRPEIIFERPVDLPVRDVLAHPQAERADRVEPFARAFPTPAIYIVRAYHDTGAKMLINGKMYTILNPQTSFGYILLQDGKTPTYGWNHRLEGARVVGNNYYSVTVPNNGAVQIVTTVEPLKQPRGARDSGFMVQSNIGDKGDFEVVVPHEKAGLVYCSRNNDTKGFPWGNSAVFAQELGYVDAVSLIQSNFGNPGNLEVVARVKDRLFYLSGSGFDRTWSKPVTIAEGVTGNPALIQGRYGIHGNFELVVPFAGGGIIHYWRNNDDPKLPWLRGDIFAQNLGNVDAVALIQSNIQDKAGEPQPGHLEVIARVGNDLIHLWRNDGPAFKWSDSDPVKFYEGATGIPGFIQGNYGGVGNFEVVTPSKKGGMAHLRRNNDDPKNFPWKVATMFGGGNVTAVSLLQSNFTTSTNPNISGPGDFEVAARIEGRTALYWRHDLPPFTWEDAKTFACS